MSDISNKPRKFEVWIDKGVPGKDPCVEIVDVPAGEDAEEICSEVLDEMIGSHLDTGWREISRAGRVSR